MLTTHYSDLEPVAVKKQKWHFVLQFGTPTFNVFFARSEVNERTSVYPKFSGLAAFKRICESQFGNLRINHFHAMHKVFHFKTLVLLIYIWCLILARSLPSILRRKERKLSLRKVTPILLRPPHILPLLRALHRSLPREVSFTSPLTVSGPLTGKFKLFSYWLAPISILPIPCLLHQSPHASNWLACT
jgi:hypothetical protein